MRYELRPYQQKAVDDIEKYLRLPSKQFKPGVVVMPVGSGKSLVIAETIRQLGSPTTVVFQPSVELLKQNYQKFIDQGGEASMYSASVNSKVVSNVTYVTPGSVKNSSDEFLDTEFIIVDECHLQTRDGSMFDNFVSDIESKTGRKLPLIGFTATPVQLDYKFRLAKLNFLTSQEPRMWDNIVHVTQVSEMYDGGFLTPLRFRTFGYSLRDAKLRGSDYDMKGVSKMIEDMGLIKFTQELINKCIERGKKKILVFAPTVHDASLISRALENSAIISAKTKKSERRDIVDNFVNGDLTTLLNFNTLSVGFDAPNIDLIICLRPTTSYAIYYQLLGRGVRLSEGKEVCDVIDLSGNYDVFGGIEDMKVREVNGWGTALTVNNHIISDVPTGMKVLVNHIDTLERTVWFGKSYKGFKFKDVPFSYLKWVSENFKMDYNMKNIFKQLGVI